MSEQHKTKRMDFAGGKYTVISDGAVLTVLHYGSPWREFIGDEFVSTVFNDALMLKTRCEQVQSAMEAVLSHEDDAATERAAQQTPAGWVLVPVEPTLEMLKAMHTACLCFYEDDQRAAYHAMLAATPVPRPAPRNPQKPELRVGQVWRTRGGGVAAIVDETKNPSHPFWCESVRDSWSVTKDGNYISKAVPAPYDLIELISDVPQKGGEA